MTDTLDPDVRPLRLRTNDDSGLVATAFALPTLSWELEASRGDIVQVAYEVQRSSDPGFQTPLSSGRIETGSMFGAEWIGPPLTSRERSWVRVRVWTRRGVSTWSEALALEGALYHLDDWLGRPISPRINFDLHEPGPVPVLRRTFFISDTITSARLYVTAFGIHECWINGQRVSSDLFEPGWSVYPRRLLYATYDVAPLLQQGRNVIAAAVGDGWWRGNLTWMGRRAVYGATTALLAQLELMRADGTREVVATDEAWRSAVSEFDRADIYDGASAVLRGDKPAWASPEIDDARWDAAVRLPLPKHLEQRSMPPVAEVMRLAPTLTQRGSGLTQIDCGQNLTGYLELEVASRGEAEITVRHAEVLEDDGALHTAALRAAKATDTYAVDAGDATLAPKFTYHGFRYAEVRCSEAAELKSATAVVVASDLREIGQFECSHERINQLYRNIKWSQRGNFFAIPTDCPQRDERLGWTGDIQVFAQTACTNFDSRAFLASWLVDLALEQAPDGRVPSTVPNVIQGHDFEFAGVGWGDAATLVPWALHEAYGDVDMLRRQYPSMRSWTDWCASRIGTDGTWTGDFHLGDWLDPGAPPDKPHLATTDRDFIASAYLVHSARALSRTAAVLADADSAARYRALADRTAAATWRKWRTAALGTQTGCAMAIEFGIAPASEIPAVGAALAGHVRRSRGRIATGFLGTPLVLPALTASGQIDAAYQLLLNDQSPGWLYQVANGATTMWERWDAIEPGGRINRGDMAADDAESMTSFNHYAYGSVGAWLYRTLAGIAPGEPGYRLIDFAPRPGGGLTWAKAEIDTPSGPAAIEWRSGCRELLIQITIPPGSRGRFSGPPGWLGGSEEMGSGSHEFRLESSEPTA